MNQIKPSYLILSISIIATIGLGYFFIKPLYASINTLKEESTRLTQESEALDKKLNTLKKLEKQDEEIFLVSEKLEKLIPEKPEISSFMLELDALAKDSNLTIPTITVTDKASTAKKPAKKEDGEQESSQQTNQTEGIDYPSNVSLLEYKTSVGGTYTDFLTFISKLESSNRYNALPSLSLSPSEENVTVSLSGDIFYLPINKEAEIKDFKNLNDNQFKFIESLTIFAQPKKPSELGLDGRDNPFMPF